MKLAQIRAKFDWPKHAVIEDNQAIDGHDLDLEETLRRLETARDFYDREIRQMHAFARRWGADVDDITDNRDAYGEKRVELMDAIAYVKTVKSALDR